MLKQLFFNVLFSAPAAVALHAVSLTGLHRQLSLDHKPGSNKCQPHGYFQQYLDHQNPSLGTFGQLFYWSSKYYKGPGSPVVLIAPQEANLTFGSGCITQDEFGALLENQIAKEIGAAVIAIEHRYYGSSSPYTVLSTKNLQYLTVQNAIADLVRFAQNANFPFDPSGASRPHKAPWVLSGVSYSGALAAWTQAVSPGTFWAYRGSSAVVEAIYNFWEYFYPIMEAMGKNCSHAVSLAIAHVDKIGKSGSADEKLELQQMFGLEGLEFYDDFASALQGPLFFWQYGPDYSLCETLEKANGTGQDKALRGYAKYVRNYISSPSGCALYGDYFKQGSIECFNSHNRSSPIYTDMSLNNFANRQFIWLQCNEPLAYWPAGAPKGRQTIASRFVTAEYFQRQCALFFPTEDGYTFGSARGRTVADTNAYTKGWNYTQTERVLFVNFGFDPYREATVSSDFRPGGPLQSTAKEPVFVVPDAYHGGDYDCIFSKNKACQETVKAEFAQIKSWVGEFKAPPAYPPPKE